MTYLLTLSNTGWKNIFNISGLTSKYMNYRRLHNNKTSIKPSVTHSIWNLFVNQTFWNMSHSKKSHSPSNSLHGYHQMLYCGIKLKEIIIIILQAINPMTNVFAPRTNMLNIKVSM